MKEAEQRGNHAGAERLVDEQHGLVLFFPITGQAFGDNAEKVLFHFQMASDFNTVEETARRLILEFD